MHRIGYSLVKVVIGSNLRRVFLFEKKLVYIFKRFSKQIDLNRHQIQVLFIIYYSQLV